MELNPENTAVLVTDPQNDFLSEQGVTWGLVGDSVQENHTVEHIEQLLKAAKEHGFEVLSPPTTTTPPTTAGSSAGRWRP